jgi:hypothetical protein
VGYKIEQEIFDDATHAISATKIRKEMGLWVRARCWFYTKNKSWATCPGEV